LWTIACASRELREAVRKALDGMERWGAEEKARPKPRGALRIGVVNARGWATNCSAVKEWAWREGLDIVAMAETNVAELGIEGFNAFAAAESGEKRLGIGAALAWRKQVRDVGCSGIGRGKWLDAVAISVRDTLVLSVYLK
jgi:hypothetical protein